MYRLKKKQRQSKTVLKTYLSHIRNPFLTPQQQDGRKNLKYLRISIRDRWPPNYSVPGLGNAAMGNDIDYTLINWMYPVFPFNLAAFDTTVQ
nr:unnamed protein product [Callosobruchus chinensis]